MPVSCTRHLSPRRQEADPIGLATRHAVRPGALPHGVGVLIHPTRERLASHREHCLEEEDRKRLELSAEQKPEFPQYTLYNSQSHAA